jgi:hypothetical protein
MNLGESYGSENIEPHKGWRRMVEFLLHSQDIKSAHSRSTKHLKLAFPGDKPILLLPISDWHFGSFGTDYEAIMRFCEWIHRNDVKLALIGDMLQMSIKLRGVLEVSDNALTPELQMEFLKDWMKEFGPQCLFSTWDNHSVMRTEDATGLNPYGDIMAEHCPYFNGIGHIDIAIGEIEYKIAASHFFQGRSIYNPCHGQMRYARMEAHDRDVIIAGDSHVPGMIQYKDGGKVKTAINCGSLQGNSGYARRFFSITPHPEFPCLILSNEEHNAIPFWDKEVAAKTLRGW